jgi:hypothetical protein
MWLTATSTKCYSEYVETSYDPLGNRIAPVGDFLKKTVVAWTGADATGIGFFFLQMGFWNGRLRSEERRRDTFGGLNRIGA